jgi:hypothetical protein
VRKFWHRGYVPLEAFHPFIAHDPTMYPWLKINLIMFANYSAFIRKPNLHRFARPITDFDLVYPMR